jgi:hypothetical protein
VSPTADRRLHASCHVARTGSLEFAADAVGDGSRLAKIADGQHGGELFAADAAMQAPR